MSSGNSHDEATAARELRWDWRIPVEVDERVPPGMAVLGYDADGKLVAAVNLDKTKESDGNA